MVLGSAWRTQTAFVMHPCVLPLELIGTVSALDGLGPNTGFRSITVAARWEPLATDTPLRVAPQSTFAVVSHSVAILVLGGTLMGTILPTGDGQLLAYVRATAETADLVALVGTGALILAAASLRTGRRAGRAGRTGGCWSSWAPPIFRSVGSRTASISPQAARPGD